MSPRDVLMMFSTCFEGTFSLQKASVIVTPMASFIVSSFGDVHKRCMKVLPLSLVFFSPFLHKPAERLHGTSARAQRTSARPPVTRKSSSAGRPPPLPMMRSVLLRAGGRPPALIAHLAGDVNKVAFETPLSLTHPAERARGSI